jgi:hypothetical protein
LLFPKARAAIKDIWHVVGLKGTGSDTYTVNDLFVPAPYSFTRESAADRRELGPLYRLITFQLYGCGFAAVALGIARATLDAFIAMAAAKVPMLGPSRCGRAPWCKQRSRLELLQGPFVLQLSGAASDAIAVAIRFLRLL